MIRNLITIIVRRMAGHNLGDIQFSLCVSDDQSTVNEDSDDQCGRAVTPRVDQDEDGVHSMNVFVTPYNLCYSR